MPDLETPMTEPDATSEPEPLGDAGIAALQKERDQRKALEKQIRELKPLAAKARELEEASKSELDKAAERATAAEARAAAAEAQLVRKDIAAAKGLKPEAAEFLTGTTPEEIEASADKWLALMPEQQRPPGRPVEQLQSGAVPAANQSGSSPDDWIRNAVAARQSR